MKKMEKFIRDHRADFDDAWPSDPLWDRIESQLDARSAVRRLWWPMWAAACLSLMVVAGFGIYLFGHSRGQDFVLEKMEVERYYQQKLNDGMVQLAGLKNSEEIQKDLSIPDSEITGQRPMNQREKEAQLKAIIQNFEMRLSIIEKVLEQTQTNKSEKINNDEKRL